MNIKTMVSFPHLSLRSWSTQSLRNYLNLWDFNKDPSLPWEQIMLWSLPLSVSLSDSDLFFFLALFHFQTNSFVSVSLLIFFLCTVAIDHWPPVLSAWFSFSSFWTLYFLKLCKIHKQVKVNIFFIFQSYIKMLAWWYKVLSSREAKQKSHW